METAKCRGLAPVDYQGHLIQYCAGELVCPCGWSIPESGTVDETDTEHYSMWVRWKDLVSRFNGVDATTESIIS